MSIYYQDEWVTLYHGHSIDDHREWLTADVMVSDVPYGIAYRSNSRRIDMPRSIAGDLDTSLRDAALEAWGDRPALVFGTWRVERPASTPVARVGYEGRARNGRDGPSVEAVPSRDLRARQGVHGKAHD